MDSLARICNILVQNMHCFGPGLLRLQNERREEKSSNFKHIFP